MNSYFAGVRRMRYLLGALITLVVSDGVISHFLVRHGLGREGNPFLETLVGEWSFLIIKVLGALLCALILWDIYKRRPKLAVTTTLCFVVLYAGIVLWNLSVFFTTQVWAFSLGISRSSHPPSIWSVKESGVHPFYICAKWARNVTLFSGKRPKIKETSEAPWIRVGVIYLWPRLM